MFGFLDILAELLAALPIPPTEGAINLSPSDPMEPAAEVRSYATPNERLDSRLAELATEADEERAAILASEVASLWRQEAGPTADLLLRRARDALERSDEATAERAYFHLRALEPEFAEGWIATARLAMAQTDWSFALQALNTAVSLEPRRFDGWVMLGQTLERADRPEAALQAYGEALALYPKHPQAGPASTRLERELAGRAL